MDVHIAATELGTPLICLDEPEVHLNPAVQATVLTELMQLLPNGSQLWIATHSVGMIRRAFDISTAEPSRVAFLDFGQVERASPRCPTQAVPAFRPTPREAMSVALDDLARLLAPEVLVICEGAKSVTEFPSGTSGYTGRSSVTCILRVEFKSSGGKGELEQAAQIASVIASWDTDSEIARPRHLTPESRTRLLEKDPNLRVLERHSLESYLLDDEVLEVLVADRGTRVEDAVGELKAARDGADPSERVCERSTGCSVQCCQKVLGNTEGLGENPSQFSADVLAKLITPDMKVRQELNSVLDLP